MNALPLPLANKWPFRQFLLLMAVLFISNATFSGNPKDSISSIPKKFDTTQVKQKDLIELLHLKKKEDSLKFQGNGPFLSIIPIVGYALQSGVTGALTSSTSFYSSAKRDKFSNLNACAYYSQYNQFWFIANSNIFIDKYKLHLYGDWRFYKFPTKTFGIGSQTTLRDAMPIDFSYIRFYQHFSREIQDNIFVGIGYNLDYHWNIIKKMSSGTAFTDMQIYQPSSKSVSSGVSLNFLFDNRKNSINPKGGSFASIQYRPNSTFFGSDNNWQSLIIDLRQYIRFPASSKNVLAFWSYDNLTLSGTAPYLDMPSTGWDDYSNTGRGYVPGRYVGRNILYLESEYRFTLTRNGLLGGVVFGNSQTILQNLSNAKMNYKPGYGLGLRIKMNKNSNTNLGIDYGFGQGGSRGLFFNLGEVF